MEDETQEPVPARAEDVARSADDAAGEIEKALRVGMASNTPIKMAPALLAVAAFALREVSSTIYDLARQVRELRAPAVPEKPTRPKPDKPAAGAHPRHNYNAQGVCSCGKVKSASSGGRPRKQPEAAPVAPGADPRDLPLPAVAAAPAPKPLGGVAADKFTAGGVGGAG